MNRRFNNAVSDVSYFMEGRSHLRKVNVAGQFASLSVLHSDSRLQELRNTKKHSVRTVAVPAGVRI